MSDFALLAICSHSFFCRFHVKSTMSELRKATIKSADMSEEMQQVRSLQTPVKHSKSRANSQEAIDVATAALAKYGIEKDVAAHIKKVEQLCTHPQR